MGPCMVIYNSIQTNTSIQTHHITPIEAVLSLYKCLVVYGGPWGAVYADIWSYIEFVIRPLPPPIPAQSSVYSPHSPPYTTKHFCKLATACIGVV